MGQALQMAESLQWPMEPGNVVTSCLLSSSFFSGTPESMFFLENEKHAPTSETLLLLFSLPRILISEYLSDLFPHQELSLLRCLSEGVF